MSISVQQAHTSDLELLQAFRTSRNMDFLGEVWRRNLGMLLSVAMKYLHDRETAKDACGELFLELTDKVLRHDVQQVRSWLYVLMKNHCLQRIRKEGGKVWEEVEEKKIDRVHVEYPAFEHLPKEGDDMESKLHVAMEKLNPAQKQCLELFYFQERTYKEIADTLSMELGTVKSHIQNGKRNLQMDLKKHSLN